ncbi:MAG TPA: HWE histidine kinase domain-containing protein [Rhizomicrobium sp.]|nr:HWE histidine kinase domain-containing protein [Rhizomicrobium sp.]
MPVIIPVFAPVGGASLPDGPEVVRTKLQPAFRNATPHRWSDRVRGLPAEHLSHNEREARTLRQRFLRLTLAWQRPWPSSAFAAGVLGITFLLRFALDPWLGQGQGFSLLIAAPFTITLVAGLAPGIFAGLISVFAVWFFFLGTFESFALSPHDGGTLAVYIVATALCITVSDTLRARIARLETEKSQSEKLAGHLAVLIEAIPRGILSIDGRGHIRTLNNRLAETFGYGREELLGRPFDKLLVARSGLDAAKIGQAELSGLRKDGSEFPVEILFSPFVWDGDPMTLASITDITERRLAEERERLLTRELQHRSKNLFSKVQALAIGTFRNDASMDEALNAFTERLSSLARADRWLNPPNPIGANLADVVRSELAPFADQIAIGGADVMLPPRVAQNLAMALHELATNAAKYGALSCPDGKVTVGWTVSNTGDRANVRVRWHEGGGPPVHPPQRRGFGTTLLAAAMKCCRFDYAPEGLIVEAELWL